MEHSGEFAGKSVLITGAGGGVGTALVQLFSSRGARIIGCDTSIDVMQADGFDSRHAFDLLDRNALENAANDIMASDGVPDIVINNAGWTRSESFEELDQAAINREIDLNLTGVSAVSTAIAKKMAARGHGTFVFISSVNALSHFGNPAYAAAKAGINAFARALAVEYGQNGLRANVVCPGSIHTSAWDHRIAKDPAVFDKLRRLYPLGRIVKVNEVAEAVAFLASDRASGITGTILPVDAGLMAGCRPFIDDILNGN
ncbi:SDR family oxidoreductase [Brucella pseudogrignonensis]|uniref:SDR family oxidoreductase n=1 Tax=Brucella pseudogrignonensis TaxID=419475 RepID=UPI0007DA98BD|nr:SDR family oxidoreductase [Brucella pseudogrignonensis]MQP40831.1 SDR family oxidoreductase [Ochrobactrum sp. MYb237]ANG97651.1 SDR family oxidoreductase [Brucella pseudogrignonensis]PQZ40790.1 SDR family oxidoreductase [Brucella pseudogrignonensis]PRA40490.1 SDR family oxidoreductase [Brucella pseudogrignonensis]PRA69085.1 SDR family oxidoreductase [Brucella pseudogrignonensis]